MSNDSSLFTAAELLEEYRQKLFSPVELLQSCFQTIDRLNPILNAFVELDQEGAMQEAKLARWSKGVLRDGVPATLKDQCDVIAMTTRSAKKTSDASGVDVPPAARLRTKGAVQHEKTPMSEFDWRGVSDSPLAGINRNPWPPPIRLVVTHPKIFN